MNIDLISIIGNEGAEAPFNGGHHMEDGEISADATFSGRVVNFSGRQELFADVTAEISAECSRCLSPVKEALSFTVFEIIGEDGIEPDGTILALDGIIEKNIFMNLPMRFLCGNECKGLCSECGANLNETTCDCGGGEIDERFAALKKLLD